MSYLSASLKFLVLCLPVLCVLMGTKPASAEEDIGIDFDLPPARALVRYEDELPPIAPVAALEEVSAAVDVQSAGVQARAIAPEAETVGLQFARDSIKLPVASQPQPEMGTVAQAFASEGDVDEWIEQAPSAELSSANGVLRSLDKQLRRSEETPAMDAVSVLEADILEDWIYEGGSDSLVARTVGSAEGTRKTTGERTRAYYGHTDPGNGVWNLGTFSYQHEALSPEDADEKQLRRLQRQEKQLKEKAAQWNVPLSVEVRLNGLDLANQAPLAALDKGGYIERLAEAYDRGKSGAAAIAWARTHAYFDPDKQAWDAPGLGNNRYSIQQDQERRMAAIDSALRRFKNEDTEQARRLWTVEFASNDIASASLLAEASSTEVLDDSLVAVSFLFPDAATPLLSDASLAETSEAIATEVEAYGDRASEETVASSEVALGDVENSLSFEKSEIVVGAPDNYDAIISETMPMVDTEAIALDDGLAFEETELLELVGSIEEVQVEETLVVEEAVASDRLTDSEQANSEAEPNEQTAAIDASNIPETSEQVQVAAPVAELTAPLDLEAVDLPEDELLTQAEEQTDRRPTLEQLLPREVQDEIPLPAPLTSFDAETEELLKKDEAGQDKLRTVEDIVPNEADLTEESAARKVSSAIETTNAATTSEKSSRSNKRNFLRIEDTILQVK